MAAAAIGPLCAMHLAVSRGPRRLFSDLSFEIAPGTVAILRGPNGTGKTTLLRLLAGLTEPESGEVRWAGRRWKTLCAEQRASCLYLGHSQALKDELSALDNLRIALGIDGIDADDVACARALDAAGLAGRHGVVARRLSQGQKRRVGLARLTLSDKPLWLLDEPANALDADGLALFQSLVATHAGRGGLAVIATHLPLDLAAPNCEIRLGGGA